MRSKDMRAFLCPTAQKCGPRRIFAQQKAQVYSIDPQTLPLKDNFCMHAITFSIMAGRNDILKVKFKEHVPGTRIFFAASTSLRNADGIWIEQLENTILKVSFPNTLYLMVEHAKTEKRAG
jgi:hypothetical protein